jgi:soluble lytic murein transglycosylase-like protein
MNMNRAWITRLPLGTIREVASETNIPWNLLAAIVQTESGGNPYAARFEPDYKYYFKVKEFAKQNQITDITETVLQKTSWGLCQLMGGLCRELGHTGSLLEVLDQELNLKLCAKHLLNLIKKHPERDAMLAAYNAGSPIKDLKTGKYRNQEYVDKVLGYFLELNETFGIKI